MENVKFWILLICLFLAGCQQADQIPTTEDYQIGMFF
jgi:hypothetical protein